MAREGTTRHRGDRAEALVAKYLCNRGLKLLNRNVRLGMLEVDIVAQEGNILVLVEVRTRSASSFTSGFSSVGRAKRQRLRWAAERLWRRRYQFDPSIDRIRFDVASVSFTEGGVVVEYCQSAF